MRPGDGLSVETVVELTFKLDLKFSDVVAAGNAVLGQQGGSHDDRAEVYEADGECEH
jgi:hypothetical protein